MRKVCEIAAEIKRDWRFVNFGAKPYLKAMCDVSSLSDRYGAEKGRDMVNGFLCNCSTWHGEVARRIKEELRDMLATTPVR